eukprot:gene12048-8604_t
MSGYVGLPNSSPDSEEGTAVCRPESPDFDVEQSPTEQSPIEPLKPVNSSAASDQLWIAPLSVWKVLDFVRRRPWLVVVLLLVVTLIDVLVFYLKFTMPKLNSVEIFLDPSGADMKVNAQGTAKLSALTVSVDPKAVSCAYSYRRNPEEPFSFVGDVGVDFTTGSGDFSSVVSLTNTKYSPLRRLLSDFSSSAVVNGTVALQCDISFTTTWYAVPISSHWSLSQELDVESLKEEQVKSGGGGSVSLGPRLSLEARDVSTKHIEFLLNLRLHSLRKSLQVNSFVVHVPRLVYVAALVDRASAKKSYLRVRTKATSVDLAARHPQAQVDVKLSCTPLVSSPEEIASANGSCTLLSPLDFSQFRSEVSTNGFMNVTAFSLADNFVSAYLGKYHFVRSVDASLFPGHLSLSDDDAPDAHRALTAPGAASTGGDAISTGASCVTVDSDGVYISQACAVVEAGFFKIYLGVYNDAGSAGYVRSVTSWSPSGDAFDSQLAGALTMDSTEYAVGGELFFSLPDQNMTLFAGLNKTATSSSSGSVSQLFSEALRVAWDLQNALSHGSVSADSLTLVSGFAPIKASGVFDYGDHAYLLQVLASETIGQPNVGQALTAIAGGEYGGDWSNWHWSLTNGLLTYEGSDVGRAAAALQSVVPGDDGLIAAAFLVEDGSNATVAASNITALNWKTEEGWLADGFVAVVSDFAAFDGESPLVSWHSVGAFFYGNHSYQLALLEDPLPAGALDASLLQEPAESLRLASAGSHDVVSAALLALPSSEAARRLQSRGSYDHQFLLGGNGRYGGDWEDWHATLDGAVYVFDYALQGSATGELNFDGNGDGSQGRVALQSTALDASDAAVFTTTDVASWTSPLGDWVTSGSLFALSAVNIPSAANWNASGGLDYEYQQFFAHFNESNYGAATDVANVAGKARGFYDGDWSKFSAVLSESSLVVQGDYVGGATGTVFGLVTGAGEGAEFVLRGDVTDASRQPYAATQDVLVWQTNATWLSAGQVTAQSQFSCADASAVNWDALLGFKFGEHQFYALVSENDLAFTPPTAEAAPPADRRLLAALSTEALDLQHQQQRVLEMHLRELAEDDDHSANSTSDYNVYAVALGSYAGASFLDWRGAVAYSELIYAQSVVGHAIGAVQFDVSSSGDAAAVLFDAQILDASFVADFATLQQVQWLSPDYDWLASGSVALASNLYISPLWVAAQDDFYAYNDDAAYTPNWNITAGFHYGDHRYGVSFAETDYGAWATSGANVAVTGSGSYGGDWSQWQATLRESTLVLGGSVTGHARGIAGYTAQDSANAVNGTALLQAEVFDAAYASQVNASQVIHWQTPAEWTDAGSVYAESLLAVAETMYFNASLGFYFEDHAYGVFAEDFQCFTGGDCFASDDAAATLDHFYVQGRGTYGGDAYVWFLTLLEGSVLENGALLGSSSGRVEGVSRNGDWLSMGSLSYWTQTDDADGGLVLRTDGSTRYSPAAQASYTESGAFAVASAVNMPGFVAWNASAAFSYGDHQYALEAAEAAYGVATSAEPETQNFLLLVAGGYGAASATQAWVSVTESLVALGNETLASVRAYAAIDVPTDDAATGSIVVNVADYDSAALPPIAPDAAYPVEGSVLWTGNSLTWSGDASLGLGQLSTQTFFDAAEQFYLRSNFNASFANGDAYFSVDERLEGADGLSAWARAAYDLSSGMLANMGGEVYYADDLLFGANTAYDLQLQDAANPNANSAAPTSMPTAAPTAVGTTAAPTAAPTAAVSAVPTAAPTAGVSAVPTAAGSDAPTASPTQTPTASPTVAATGVPTAAPTVAPTAAPSAAPTSSTPVVLAVSQVISGLNATLFQTSANYSLALTNAIASCMVGVSASDIRNLVVVPYAGSRRVLRVGALAAAASLATYEIYVASPTAETSAASLSAQLETSLSTGAFDTALNTFATVYSAPGLEGCTSSSATIVNVSGSSDGNSDKLSAGAIAGIVIGCVAGVVLIAACGYVWFTRRGSLGAADDAVAQPADGKKAAEEGPDVSDARSDSTNSNRSKTRLTQSDRGEPSMTDNPLRSSRMRSSGEDSISTPTKQPAKAKFAPAEEL